MKEENRIWDGSASDPDSSEPESDTGEGVDPRTRGPIGDITQVAGGFQCRFCPSVRLVSEADVAGHLQGSKHKKRFKGWVRENRSDEQKEAYRSAKRARGAKKRAAQEEEAAGDAAGDGTARKKRKKKKKAPPAFAGKCHACSKEGHRVSDCPSNAGKKSPAKAKATGPAAAVATTAAAATTKKKKARKSKVADAGDA
jgi:hypothetical protein